MQDAIETRITEAYNAFNTRDIDGALRCMQPDVQWPNGWEGGYVHGHDAVREYWTRQWQQLDPYVTPVAFAKRDDGRTEVSVQQNVKDKQGAAVFNGLVTHIYTLKNGLIAHMEIEKP